MQDSETSDRRVAALSVDRQVAYLAICIERVKRALDETGDVPLCVRDSVLHMALEQAWSFVETGTARSEPDVNVVLDLSWDELADDGRTEVQHLASAAGMLVRGLPASRREARRVLNHLDACVQILDPEQVGHIEEDEWRASLLAAIEGLPPGVSPLSLRTALSDVPRWQQRYLADWGR